MSRTIIPGTRKGKCFHCGRYCGTQEHHMMHGPNRKNAEHFGLKVNLCPECHREVHEDPEHTLDHELQRLAQEEFERRWGHKEWMKVFGKNYLDKEET